MKIGIPRESLDGETRVALVPSMVGLITKQNHEVCVAAGAGAGSAFSDEDYEKAGAKCLKDNSAIFGESDVTIKVQPLTKDEAGQLKDGSIYIGYMAPFYQKEVIEILNKKKITAFAMEFIPRITRAQSMDSLSSMATVSGYKAVLLAAAKLGKFFPLLMTAAGTVPPASVFILGAGVAGLQAIATAKRLGAKVEAFDPRIAVKEQVESLGAMFVQMEMPEDAETEGGYAKEMGDEFLKKEQEAIAARLPKIDVVITTAQIFGKAAPVLITEEMVKMMRPGSIIIDLAAEQGGNCELTEAGKDVEKHGVSIMGTVNLPATLPVHASQMYSKNITNLFKNTFAKEDAAMDFEDEITKGACICRAGEVVNDLVKNVLYPEGAK